MTLIIELPDELEEALSNEVVYLWVKDISAI